MEIPDKIIEKKAEVKQSEAKPIMKRRSPIDMFFALGPKDPKRKADFDYCLFWIIFLTFASLAINYIRLVFTTGDLTFLGWGIVMSIFSYFNFNNLKSMREARKFMKEAEKTGQAMQPIKIESKEEMMEEFK